MPVYKLPEQHAFPHPDEAEENGLLAVGGDLDPSRVLLAYYTGIFPWYSEGQPILWWSPDPRMVLIPSALRIPRSLSKRIRRGDYRVTMDTAFESVIRHCQKTPRPNQAGTWITDTMLKSYQKLHEMGFAHSVETWDGETLIGGLYGVSIGRFFAGESMFAHQSDASKFALVYLVKQLERWGFPLVDCQMHTQHLERFGASAMPRSTFLKQLAEAVKESGRSRIWSFDTEFHPLP